MTGESAAVGQGVSADKLLEPYLTPKQLADLLQVSVKTIYRWVEEDPTMPALRAGVVRFPQARVLAWLQSREQGPGRRRQSRKQVRSGGAGTAGRNGGAPLRVSGEPDPAPCAHSCAPETP